MAIAAPKALACAMEESQVRRAERLQHTNVVIQIAAPVEPTFHTDRAGEIVAQDFARDCSMELIAMRISI